MCTSDSVRDEWHHLKCLQKPTIQCEIDGGSNVMHKPVRSPSRSLSSALYRRLRRQRFRHLPKLRRVWLRTKATAWVSRGMPRWRSAAQCRAASDGRRVSPPMTSTLEGDEARFERPYCNETKHRHLVKAILILAFALLFLRAACLSQSTALVNSFREHLNRRRSFVQLSGLFECVWNLLYRVCKRHNYCVYLFTMTDDRQCKHLTDWFPEAHKTPELI